jgi:glutamyl-Q tRNA(Asp) synthetase
VTNAIVSTTPTADLGSLLSQGQFNQYRGRFAPSPSGHLHFGSLIAALGSFLQARSQQGQWLLRIEDIDPPREMPGADKAILHALEVLGLHWDGEVRYQSQQSELYLEVLNELAKQGFTYQCRCTRKQIRAYGGIYNGNCRDKGYPNDNTSTRLVNRFVNTHFNDLLLGEVKVNTELAGEDFVLFRRDGLFAYQLAVVVDDIDQGISEIVRGADLLDPTARQIAFYQTLGVNTPSFIHLPLAVTDNGLKLSKQNHSPAINLAKPRQALIDALSFLGQQPPTELMAEPVDNIISWAIANWQLTKVPSTNQVCDASHC